MRVFIALVVIAYLVGVGVWLAPTVEAGWSTIPASQLTGNVVQQLPGALAWPVAAYRKVTGNAGGA
jgi:Flp pilus assembly pilin Flp